MIGLVITNTKTMIVLLLSLISIVLSDYHTVDSYNNLYLDYGYDNNTAGNIYTSSNTRLFNDEINIGK